MTPQFTESVQHALERAFQYASERKHTQLTENHLLLAFFEDRAGYFCTLATALKLNPDTLILQLKEALDKVATFKRSVDVPTLPSSSTKSKRRTPTSSTSSCKFSTTAD